jgi:hypothetical protein
MTARSYCHRRLGFIGVRLSSPTITHSHFDGVSGGDNSFKNAKKGLDKVSLVIVPYRRNRKDWKNHDGLGRRAATRPTKKENQ